jgi:hypothetical protein
VTGRGDGGDGSDGCEAGDGEERADCRLSSLVFDADSAEESRRRSVAATVKEEELALPLGSRRERWQRWR